MFEGGAGDGRTGRVKMGDWAYEEGACEGGFDIGFGGLSLHC